MEKWAAAVEDTAGRVTARAFWDELDSIGHERLEKTAKKKGEELKPGELKGGKDEPASKDEPGEGGRFKAMKEKAKRQGARDPEAVAAAIGRAKWGKKRMAQMAAKGRKS